MTFGLLQPKLFYDLLIFQRCHKVSPLSMSKRSMSQSISFCQLMGNFGSFTENKPKV